MNASAYEQELATAKGVRIVTNAQPVALHGNGAVAEIAFEYTDDSLQPTGERFTLVADQVFKAIGQTLDGADLPELDGRKIKPSPGQGAPLSTVCGPVATAPPAATI